MSKTLAKVTGQPRISTKLHRHLKKQGHADVTLKDIQRSLSGIGVSLSKRVIEERETRQHIALVNSGKVHPLSFPHPYSE